MAEPGDVINGRYALRSRIDSGATADVYLADDLRLGRQVAVKVLSPEQARAQRGIDRFRAEAQAAAALSHPNIVAIYDWGTTDDTAFLVMQYVAGQDLRSVLRERGPLSERIALAVAADIAAALAVAHKHGIVHRDVKPRNVLMDEHGSALLADFGIAAPTNGSAGKDAVYGTALYVSPEQAQGLVVDGRGDVYSLGAVLYELLCGSPPFVGETAGEVARQHVSAAVVSPRRRRPAVSASTEAIVLRALEKEPARRFGSAEEMREALLVAAARIEATSRELEATVELPTATAAAVPVRAVAAAMATREATDVPTGDAAKATVTHAATAPTGAAALAPTGGVTLAPEAAAAGGPTRARAAVAATGGAAGLSAGEAAPRRVDDRRPRRRQRLRAPRWALVAVPFVVLLLAAVIALPGLARGRQASVPDLAGHTLQDAQAAVAAAGLQLTTEEQTTLDTSAGVIVTQDPLPGSRPAAGSTVHAVVSAGVSVPDVMGLQCTEARAALGGRGWTVKPVRWRVANVSEFGKVVAQDPAAGSVVKDKGEISVQVAGPVRPC